MDSEVLLDPATQWSMSRIVAGGARVLNIDGVEHFGFNLVELREAYQEITGKALSITDSEVSATEHPASTGAGASACDFRLAACWSLWFGLLANAAPKPVHRASEWHVNPITQLVTPTLHVSCSCQVQHLFKKNPSLGVFSKQTRITVYEAGTPGTRRSVRKCLVCLRVSELPEALWDSLEATLAAVSGYALGQHVHCYMMLETLRGTAECHAEGFGLLAVLKSKIKYHPLLLSG